MNPEVTIYGILNMQVCVPESWTDEQILEFAEKEYPCGTSGGWTIRREGHELLDDDPERNPCDKKEGYVHVMLDS